MGMGGPMGGPMGGGFFGGPMGMPPPFGMGGGNWEQPDYNPMPGVTKAQDSMATTWARYMGGSPMARFLAGSILDMPDMWWLSAPAPARAGITRSPGHRVTRSPGQTRVT